MNDGRIKVHVIRCRSCAVGSVEWTFGARLMIVIKRKSALALAAAHRARRPSHSPYVRGRFVTPWYFRSGGHIS